jgi:hypothetical protein
MVNNGGSSRGPPGHCSMSLLARVLRRLSCRCHRNWIGDHGPSSYRTGHCPLAVLHRVYPDDVRQRNLELNRRQDLIAADPALRRSSRCRGGNVLRRPVELRVIRGRRSSQLGGGAAATRRSGGQGETRDTRQRLCAGQRAWTAADRIPGQGRRDLGIGDRATRYECSSCQRRTCPKTRSRGAGC